MDDVIGSSRAWQLMLKHGFKDLFTVFFQHYAVRYTASFFHRFVLTKITRTLKSAVKAELTIPQQRRYLVSIELGRVERQVTFHDLYSPIEV